MRSNGTARKQQSCGTCTAAKLLCRGPGVQAKVVVEAVSRSDPFLPITV
jgi:hypothetical protein